jgi:pimeloyl-ACP methyl ester carboxylesterase
LKYRLHGTKPYQAVAVHGGPGAPGSAYSLAKGLAEITGTLEPFQTKYSVDGQVDELAGQIRLITSEPVFAFGHSWGAWLVLLLTYKYPMLIRKSFLIGAGVMSSKYGDEIAKRRLASFTEKEATEYQQIIKELELDTAKDKSRLLRKLGKLTEKSDNYCVEAIIQDAKEMLPMDANQYISVWSEGAKLRSEGYFEKIALQINKPIRILHGANDPSPIKGIAEPLEGKIPDIRWYEIPRCGHYPWKEKYAKHMFWDILRKEIE